MIDLAPLFGQAEPTDAQAISFRVFPKMGEERWLLEATQRRPWHLKTWPRANLRARLIYRMAWALGAFGLHFPSRVEIFSVASGSIYAQLRAQFDQLGIFLGTPGPNRKFVIYAETHGRSVFIKVPIGPASAALVAQETIALYELAQDSELVHMVPRAETVAGQLAVENIEIDGVEHAELDTTEVVRVHDLLERRSRFARPVCELRCDWENGPRLAPVDHTDATRKAIDEARGAANAFLDRLDPELPVQCYMAHGDFTRWNVLRAAGGTARIIDWELYGPKPRHFDLLHYYVSNNILVAKKSALEILTHLEEIGRTRPFYENWWLDVGLYFSYQALYYGSVYDRQAELHIQAIWQLRAWSEILSLLPNKAAR